MNRASNVQGNLAKKFDISLSRWFSEGAVLFPLMTKAKIGAVFEGRNSLPLIIEKSCFPLLGLGFVSEGLPIDKRTTR